MPRSPRNWLNNWFVAGGIMASASCLLGFTIFPRWTSDSEWYLALATGGNNVPRPWGLRILHPFLAGWISRTFGISIENAFVALAVVSAFIVFGATAKLAHRVTGNPWWAAFR